MMTLQILGSGTSQGIPVIGCTCMVCTSPDSRDKRLRTAAIFKSDSINVAIDAGPDFRQQMLRVNQRSLDAILLTHEHNDHIIGIDDVRPFVHAQQKEMQVYGLKRVLEDLKKRFAYAFDTDPYPGAPRFEAFEIMGGQNIVIQDIVFQVLDVMHGSLPILGYKCGNTAYITDAKYLSDATKQQLYGIDQLVINALHHSSHPAHLNLEEALLLLEELKPKRTFFIHVSHLMGRTQDIEKTLPENIRFTYDGLVLPVEL